MTPAPLPPARLSEPAKAAWHRIYGSLAARGEWDEVYITILEVAACQCALYIEAARHPGVDPRLLENIRLDARHGLAEMLYLPAGRVTLALLTPEGLDAEISAVCAPLTHPVNDR